LSEIWNIDVPSPARFSRGSTLNKSLDIPATQKTISKKQDLTKFAQELEQSSKKINIESAEAEEALEKAMPALEQARIALEQLNKNDITEIRSFATPPESVQIVCECVAIIKGYREISWKVAKGMMAEGNFLKSLQELNCDNITTKQVANVRAHLKVSWDYLGNKKMD
jgi:dynein heavy chain